MNLREQDRWPFSRLRETLYLIDIDQALEGFRKFISAWVYRVSGVTLLDRSGTGLHHPLPR